MSSSPAPGAGPGGRRSLRRVGRRLRLVASPPVETGPTDVEVVVAEIRAGNVELLTAGEERRARLEAVVSADAEARERGATELLRILSDQSAAADDAGEVLGRILAGLVADVAALRAEVARLTEALPPTRSARPDGGAAPAPASGSDRVAPR